MATCFFFFLRRIAGVRADSEAGIVAARFLSSFLLSRPQPLQTSKGRLRSRALPSLFLELSSLSLSLSRTALFKHNTHKKMARFSSVLLALVAALALTSKTFVSADDGGDCIEWANAIQEPASPCYEFGQSLRANQNLLANGACSSFDSTGAKPSAACCDLATRLTACRCNGDLHQLTGKTMTFASYRSTMFYCHATCTDPVTC